MSHKRRVKRRGKGVHRSAAVEPPSRPHTSISPVRRRQVQRDLHSSAVRHRRPPPDSHVQVSASVKATVVMEGPSGVVQLVLESPTSVLVPPPGLPSAPQTDLESIRQAQRRAQVRARRALRKEKEVGRSGGGNRNEVPSKGRRREVLSSGKPKPKIPTGRASSAPKRQVSSSLPSPTGRPPRQRVVAPKPSISSTPPKEQPNPAPPRRRSPIMAPPRTPSSRANSAVGGNGQGRPPTAELHSKRPGSMRSLSFTSPLRMSPGVVVEGSLASKILHMQQENGSSLPLLSGITTTGAPTNGTVTQSARMIPQRHPVVENPLPSECKDGPASRGNGGPSCLPHLAQKTSCTSEETSSGGRYSSPWRNNASPSLGSPQPHRPSPATRKLWTAEDLVNQSRETKARERQGKQEEKLRFRRAVYAYNQLLRFVEEHTFRIMCRDQVQGINPSYV